MLSLPLPIPTKNTLISLRPKHFCSRRTCRAQTHPFSPLPSPKPLKPLDPTTVARVALREHVQEEEERRNRSALAGVSPEGEPLPSELQDDLMPKHVAVIMDGNGRWAHQRGLPTAAGHEAGSRSLRELVELCGHWGIRVLTVFAFSYDNWIRPKVEVDFLMTLFEREIKSQLDIFLREGIRISVIGDSSKLPESLQKLISDAEETTKANSRLQLIVAVSYSGKYDIIQACRGIASKVKDGSLELEDISESLIEQELETNCTEFPYPDLLIRTSGEQRVSNFLLWQLAYTEFFFARELWPDFGKSEFVEALFSFQQRQRRYGARL
ncbi:hypothetical protein FH972_011689 [Carpinus fangiana]|uniref:Alkyl transferase n=1 Tax=Carpinus fangiana TaxID=176857 RepID=A0A660KS97_9ROSI|nr:hypothetical protein FH972_011689 [Carpinus fangiana]